MTQTLANRMTTDTDQVFVACNPLLPQEEMLAIDQMAETYGGNNKPKPKGRLGLLLWVAYEVYEFVSEMLEEDDCCCCCCCDCCD